MDRALAKIEYARESGATELTLATLPIALLPTPLFELRNLTSLTIDGLPQVTNLPEKWDALASLVTLTISNTGATHAGAGIAQLSSLKELHLCHNELVELSADLTFASTLEEFCVSDNKLTTLPELPIRGKLSVLDVSHNELENLDWLRCDLMLGLEMLYVSHNRLKELPHAIHMMQNLIVLDVADNELAELPISIGNMKQLQELYLSNNKLTALHPCMGELQALMELAVDGNPIRTPPMLVCNGGAASVVAYLREVSSKKGASRPRGSLSRQRHFSIGREIDGLAQPPRIPSTQDIGRFLTSSSDSERRVPVRRRKSAGTEESTAHMRIAAAKDKEGDAAHPMPPSSPPLDMARVAAPHGRNKRLLERSSASCQHLFRMTPRSRAQTSSVAEVGARESFELTVGTVSIVVYHIDEDDPLVARCEGIENTSEYMVKTTGQDGREGMFLEDTEKFASLYDMHCFGKDHCNMIGVDAEGSMVIVSMTKEPFAGKEYLAIVRVPQANALIRIPLDAVDKSRFSKKPRARDLLKALLDQQPGLQGVNMMVVNDPAICADLKQHEQSLLVSCLKVGVLNVAPGQRTEEQMYSNNTMSREFCEFLSIIGETVALEGWSGYSGGLDVKRGSTGERSVYTKYFNLEIMFHVAAYLPFEDHNEQQLARKRHIGNDIVVVIFLEGEEKFDPSVMTSHFNHVFIVVQPRGDSSDQTYKVSVAWKKGVRWFGPPLPRDGVFQRGEQFRKWILTKMINAERAAYCAEAFATKLSRTRQTLMQSLAEKYVDISARGRTAGSFIDRMLRS